MRDEKEGGQAERVGRWDNEEDEWERRRRLSLMPGALPGTKSSLNKYVSGGIMNVGWLRPALYL